MVHPVKMRFYNKIPKRYITTLLSKFTNLLGELRPAAEGGKIVQVIIAKGKYNTLLGWCAVYKSLRDYAPIYCKDYSLGIFVDPKYRHRGIGGKLRRKAILWCLRQGKPVWWFRDGIDAILTKKGDMQYIDEIWTQAKRTNCDRGLRKTNAR